MLLQAYRVIDLTDERPLTAYPTTILEIPGSGDEVRILGDGSARRTVPLGREIDLGKDDWVVAKIDADLPVTEVLGLLDLLAGLGVRRVSLATLPLEYATSATIPRLRFENRPGVPALELEPRDRSRSVIVPTARKP